MRRLALAALIALSACTPRGYHHGVTPLEVFRRVPYRLELQWVSTHPAPRHLDGTCYGPGEVDHLGPLLEARLGARATPDAQNVAEVAVVLEELAVEWERGPSGAVTRRARVRLTATVNRAGERVDEREIQAEAAEEAAPGAACGPLVRETLARAAARVDRLVGDALGIGAQP